MKVKELIDELSKLPPEKEILITSMDDSFCCDDFELHSYIPEYDDADEAIEIILPYYFSDWDYESGTDDDDDNEDEEIF